MKQITVIDSSSDIKNKLPKEYRNMKVRFFQYSLDAFCYKNDDITVIANGYTGDNIYRAELLAEETIETILNETDWGEFVILDKRNDEDNKDE